MSEVEVIELEKRFWSLVGNSSSGRIDISIITPLVSPPLPQALVPGLFKAFDENQVHICFCYFSLISTLCYNETRKTLELEDEILLIYILQLFAYIYIFIYLDI